MSKPAEGLAITNPIVHGELLHRFERTFGGLMLPDGRPGIKVSTVGDKVTVALYGWQQVPNSGGKVWGKTREISMCAREAAILGEVITRAADYLNKSGGSA